MPDPHTPMLRRIGRGEGKEQLGREEESREGWSPGSPVKGCSKEEVLVQGAKCHWQAKWDEGWEPAIECSSMDQCGVGIKRAKQIDG